MSQKNYSNPSKKLRIGLLLDSFHIPAWSYSAVEQIKKLDVAEIVVIIQNQAKSISDSSSKLFWKGRSYWLYSFFYALDEKLFSRAPNPLESRDLRLLFPDTTVIPFDPDFINVDDISESTELERIKNYDLDILINLGTSEPANSILSAARYGVWGYRYGDDRVLRGCPPGFWEVVLGLPVTGCSLFSRRQVSVRNETLYKSWFFTYPLSPARNRQYFLWAATPFLSRQIEFLARFGETKFYRDVDRLTQEFDFYDGANFTIPSNWPALRAIIIILSRLLSAIWQRVFYIDQWFLLFDLDHCALGSFNKFKKIVPPRDRFWADPHVIYRDNRYFIFLEEFLYKTQKAHISVIEMDKRGNYTTPIRVLEKKFHLSYPFVFDWEDKCYMVPESAENRTIDLYECIEFPDKWQLKLTLMQNVKAVDTTLFSYQGKWWLFTAIAQNESGFPQVELFLFFSDELITNNWKSHPLNPIVSDTRKARPAGRIFVQDGKIYRPSQVCTSTYGSSFDLNEILVLSETEYVEKGVISIEPRWDNKVHATHTFLMEHQLTMIDACWKTHRGL